MTRYLYSALLAIACFCASATCRVLDPEEEPGLFEGDIALANVEDVDVQSRNGLNRAQHKSRLWPRGEIRYAISPLYSSDEMIMIEKSIRMINAMTCIQFVPLQRQLREGEDLLLIWPVKYPKGCWSYIGRVGGVQILSLEKGRDVDDALDDDGPEQIDEADERIADVASWIRQKFGYAETGAPKPRRKRKAGCFGAEGRVTHELLHAIGMFHEQSRPDRDKFIDIHHENILKGRLNSVAVDLLIHINRENVLISRVHQQLQQAVAKERHLRIRVRLPVHHALRIDVLQQEQSNEHDHCQEEVPEEERGRNVRDASGGVA